MGSFRRRPTSTLPCGRPKQNRSRPTARRTTSTNSAVGSGFRSGSDISPRHAADTSPTSSLVRLILDRQLFLPASLRNRANSICHRETDPQPQSVRHYVPSRRARTYRLWRCGWGAGSRIKAALRSALFIAGANLRTLQRVLALKTWTVIGRSPSRRLCVKRAERNERGRQLRRPKFGEIPHSGWRGRGLSGQSVP